MDAFLCLIGLIVFCVLVVCLVPDEEKPKVDDAKAALVFELLKDTYPKEFQSIKMTQDVLLRALLIVGDIPRNRSKLTEQTLAALELYEEAMKQFSSKSSEFDGDDY